MKVLHEPFHSGSLLSSDQREIKETLDQWVPLVLSDHKEKSDRKVPSELWGHKDLRVSQVRRVKPERPVPLGLCDRKDRKDQKVILEQ